MKIWVFFWSRSAEHDVSITSAYVVMKWLARIPEYEIVPIYITREWSWYSDPSYTDIKNLKNLKPDHEILLNLSSSDQKMHLEKRISWVFSKKELLTIDVAFHVIHGLGGEDGSIQWLCELLRVPYVWPGILGGSMTLDKCISKEIFRAHGFPITKYLVYKRGESDTKVIENELRYPLFVKPYNLGSSIGISRVTDVQWLTEAIEVAEHFSDTVIIEEWVVNPIELNCAVAEIDGEIVTSLVEQPIPNAEFLSFEAKYIVSDEGGWSMSGNKKRLKIPAEIPDDITEKIQSMTKELFQIFRLGWAPRIDWLYDKEENQLYVNEINPIPWALQFHLWEASGINQRDFLKWLIQSAIVQNERRNVHIDFKSNILDHTISFMK